MIKDIHEIKECPDCASLNIIYSDARDQVICKDCGLIFEPFAQMTAVSPGESVAEKTVVKRVKKSSLKRIKKSKQKK